MAQRHFLTMFGRVASLLVALFGSNLDAVPLELHFWPTATMRFKPDETGALYAWPDFQVILQFRSEKAVYSPAVIGDDLAKELSAIFEPDAKSALRIFREGTKGVWGLTIPGGTALHAGNEELLEAMLAGFTSCLSSLDQNEFDRIKGAISSPNSLIFGAGDLLIDEQQKAVAKKMHDNFRKNRCRDKVATVTEPIKSRSRHHLLGLLTGKTREGGLQDGASLVLTTLFKDLLFSSEGLWVRTALSKIQGFIEQRMKGFPSISDKNWLARDYESYVDLILLTDNHTGLSKSQYLSLGRICGINDWADAFKTCSLKRLLMTNQMLIVNLSMGSLHSTIYVRRA